MKTHICIASFPICIVLESCIERINIIYISQWNQQWRVCIILVGRSGTKTYTKQYQLVMMPYQIANSMLCVCPPSPRTNLKFIHNARRSPMNCFPPSEETPTPVGPRSFRIYPNMFSTPLLRSAIHKLTTVTREHAPTSPEQKQNTRVHRRATVDMPDASIRTVHQFVDTRQPEHAFARSQPLCEPPAISVPSVFSASTHARQHAPVACPCPLP